MLFNSYAFVFVFLPAVVLGFAILARQNARRATLVFLTLASLFFYAWWDWHFVFLIVLSILFNFSVGLRLQRRAAADNAALGGRGLLAFGIVANLAVLGYFKYRSFFLTTVNLGFGGGWSVPALVLPLGISFFTFEQITYLVDAYRGETGRYDFLSYCVFITFFPHLIAGPIVRYRDLVPQLHEESTFRFDVGNVSAGLMTFAIGLFKKVMIADAFSPWVKPLFDILPSVSFTDAWGVTLTFAMQLYFDFSGYSDMAIGLALMLNVRLPENFDSPYKADSIIDFWRRWHMTLSYFLRDYLYIPLGGNRHGDLRQYANVFVTMLLGGLWHGASWTFVAWGALHGGYVVVNHVWRRAGVPLPRSVAWPLTVVAVLVGWALFRAPSFERAQVILTGMAGLSGFDWNPTFFSFGQHKVKRLLVALAIVLWCPNRRTMMSWEWRNDYAYAAVFALLAGLSILRLGDPSPFLYFQF